MSATNRRKAGRVGPTTIPWYPPLRSSSYEVLSFPSSNVAITSHPAWRGTLPLLLHASLSGPVGHPILATHPVSESWLSRPMNGPARWRLPRVHLCRRVDFRGCQPSLPGLHTCLGFLGISNPSMALKALPLLSFYIFSVS